MGGRAARTGSIGELIDIHALEPDGLIVTGAGSYVRVIDCARVPNPISADPAQITMIEEGWGAVFAAIPDHQGLSLYAQVDPIAIDDAMLADHERVQRAITDDLDANPPRTDLARTRRRFLQAQRQSVTVAAQGEQPAVQARYWVAVPWQPEIALKQRFKSACTPPHPEHRTSWEAAHQRAARDSMAYTLQVAGLLSGLGIDPYVMGPVEILAGLWERLHPAARSLPDFDALDGIARIVQASSPDEAAAHRQAILDALTAGEPVGIDATDRRFLRHTDGTFEETMHLATVPQDTSPWWLAHLLQVPMAHDDRCPRPCRRSLPHPGCAAPALGAVARRRELQTAPRPADWK